MPTGFKHRATIKKGQISLYDPDKWRTQLHKLEGKPVFISVEEQKSRRSIKQNSFYWLYLGIIEEETGNFAEDLHEYFKRKHLPARFVTVLNKEIRLPATTTNLDKIEFTNYLDKICAESGVPIPDPQSLYAI